MRSRCIIKRKTKRGGASLKGRRINLRGGLV